MSKLTHVFLMMVTLIAAGCSAKSYWEYDRFGRPLGKNPGISGSTLRAAVGNGGALAILAEPEEPMLGEPQNGGSLDNNEAGSNADNQKVLTIRLGDRVQFKNQSGKALTVSEISNENCDGASSPGTSCLRTVHLKVISDSPEQESGDKPGSESGESPTALPSPESFTDY